MCAMSGITYIDCICELRVRTGSYIQAIAPSRLERHGDVCVVVTWNSEKIGDVVYILLKLVVDPGYRMICDSLDGRSMIG